MQIYCCGAAFIQLSSPRDDEWLWDLWREVAAKLSTFYGVFQRNASHSRIRWELDTWSRTWTWWQHLDVISELWWWTFKSEERPIITQLVQVSAWEQQTEKISLLLGAINKSEWEVHNLSKFYFFANEIKIISLIKNKWLSKVLTQATSMSILISIEKKFFWKGF